MIRLLCSLLLMALPASATHETFGPLAPNLPVGSDQLWSYGYTSTGWQASNHTPQRCQKSLRIFGVSGRLLNTLERPFTYTVKVTLTPDMQRLDPAVGAGAGIIMHMDTRNDKWPVLALKQDNTIEQSDYLPKPGGTLAEGQMRPFARFKPAGIAIAKEAEFKVEEREGESEIFVNGKHVFIYGEKPRGSLGIIVFGCGGMHFREFTLIDKHGAVVPMPSSPPPQQRPSVRR